MSFLSVHSTAEILMEKKHVRTMCSLIRVNFVILRVRTNVKKKVVPFSIEILTVRWTKELLWTNELFRTTW